MENLLRSEKDEYMKCFAPDCKSKLERYGEDAFVEWWDCMKCGRRFTLRKKPGVK